MATNRIRRRPSFSVSARNLVITKTNTKRTKPRERKADQDRPFDAERAWPRKKGQLCISIFLPLLFERLTCCIFHTRSSNDLLSKASSCHSSSAGLSRDLIEHDQWDRSKLMGFQGKLFSHDNETDESKAKKKQDHALVKYIKYQVFLCCI